MKLRLYGQLIKQSFQELMVYRSSAVLTFLVGTLFFVTEMAAGLVFYEHVDTILGWERKDYLLLISTASLITYLYQMCFAISHELLAEMIVEGELDFTLIRPVNSYLYYALNRFDFSSAMNALLAMGVQAYFISQYPVTWWQLLFVILYIILGVILVFLLNQIVVTFTFWKENASSMLAIPEYLLEFSSRPLDIYPRGIRFVVTWIVPVVYLINAPVLILKQQFSLVHLFGVVGVIAILSLYSVYLWYKGLAEYASAN